MTMKSPLIILLRACWEAKPAATAMGASGPASEACHRLEQGGANRLPEPHARTDWDVIFDQINSLPVYLLGAAAFVSVLTGRFIDAVVVMGVVAANAAIGYITETRAEKTISSLSETGVRAVNVLRDGQVRLVPVETLVPGDVLELTPGSYIAADMRLLKGHRLSIDESALTGESMPVSKEPGFLGDEDTALGDRSNMAYMGTHVTGGSGRGMVVATAAATELGQIQTMVGEAEALEVLEAARRNDMGDTLMLRDLAIAYNRAGDQGMAALVTAERLALNGDADDAALQARRALATLPEGSPGWLRALTSPRALITRCQGTRAPSASRTNSVPVYTPGPSSPGQPSLRPWWAPMPTNTAS